MVIGQQTEKAVVMSFRRTANEKHIPLGTKGAKQRALSKHELERKQSENMDRKKRKGKCVGRFAESYPVKSEAQDRTAKLSLRLNGYSG